MQKGISQIFRKNEIILYNFLKVLPPFLPEKTQSVCISYALSPFHEEMSEKCRFRLKILTFFKCSGFYITLK